MQHSFTPSPLACTGMETPLSSRVDGLGVRRGQWGGMSRRVFGEWDTRSAFVLLESSGLDRSRG